MDYKSTFILGGGGKSAVTLTEHECIIESPPGFCLFTHQPLHINLADVIAVKTFNAEDSGGFKLGWPSAIKIFDTEPKFTELAIEAKEPNALKLDYVAKEENHRWQRKTLVLRQTELDTAVKWNAVINARLSRFTGRPKRLLVFVNPYGGKGLAPKIYEKQVCPLFSLAEIECQVQVTERANHALDMLQDVDLKAFDGVICVGGDGMFSELFNGLLMRTARENSVDFNDCKSDLVRPSVRVGVIPGGSTDAVALSLHGTVDVETATLHIVLGDERRVDVKSIHAGESRLIKMSVAMVSYGYFGDLLKRSEKYRWLGPKRYDVSGTCSFLANKAYTGMIRYVTDERTASHPTDEEPCGHACDVCEEDETGDGSRLVERSTKGEFMVVTAATMKCACRHTPGGVSPYAHLGDGNTDLIIVRKVGRLNYFRYLWRTALRLDSPFHLPFVEVHRVKEFSFLPSDGPAGGKSVWNCDGEVLPDVSIDVKVHRQVLPVFARGVELKSSRSKNKFTPVQED